MLDVNIEGTKWETSILTLSLFSWSGLHYTSDQSFEIQDILKSAKEELFPSKDHIMIDQHRVDRA